MKVKRGYPAEDRLTTHWERQAHGWTHYIWIDPYYVEWGSHRGTPQSDTSQRILHDRLLEGEHQDSIAKEFGKDVLQEVIHTIRHGQEVPRFLNEWRAAKTRSSSGSRLRSIRPWPRSAPTPRTTARATTAM